MAKASPQVTPWPINIVRYDVKPASSFLANEKNFRIHPKIQQDSTKSSLDELGWIDEVMVNLRLGSEWGADQGVETMINGHLRVTLALREGEDTLVPVKFVNLSPEKEALALLIFDELTNQAFKDKEKMAALMHTTKPQSASLQEMCARMAAAEGLYQGEVNGDGPDLADDATAAPRPSLSDRFIVPPFSVLDARQGYWQERKRAWLALGIQSELGRGGVAGHGAAVPGEGGGDSNISAGPVISL
jgi:hypothetical protein